MTSVFAVLLLLVAGLPLAWAFTRALPLAVVLAPVAGAAVSAAAVLLMLAFRGPLLLWFAPAFLGSVALAWLLRAKPPVPHGSWRDALLLTVPLVPPFLSVFRQPVGWDAHLIWWLHAGYFGEGGDFARDAIGNPALVFSHLDYPPLASAPVALVWQLLDVRTFFPAAIVTGAVTMSSVAMVVYAVRHVTAAGPALVSWPVAIGVGYAAWSPQWEGPTAGYSDAMCATAFAAGAVLVLFGGALADRRLLPLALLLLSASSLMKNEGLSLVLALAVVGTVKHRREWRQAAWGWLPVGVAGIWSVTTRLLGARNDVLTGGRFGALLHGDPDTLGRFPLIMTKMYDRIGPVTLLALLAAVLGPLFLRRRRQSLGLGGDAWLWAVLGLHWAGLTLIYLITPNDIRWHLLTSIDRVTIVIAVLACASVACWTVTATARTADLSTDGPADRPADRVPDTTADRLLLAE
jgi:hypothetical protein